MEYIQKKYNSKTDQNYDSVKWMRALSNKVKIKRVILYIFLFFLLIFFLPWTQNIQSKGKVTTYDPKSRPQTIHSVIAGRIEKWFVKEGDLVKKGDTILFISEVKEDYMDPNLVGRTKEQLNSKENSVKSYMGKANSLDQQIDALIDTRNLKLEQTTNKVQQIRLKIVSDSMDYVAAKSKTLIAKEQYERMEELNKQGLKSLTDLENRRLVYQKAQAEMISQENQLLSSRNELINTQIEYTSLNAQYRDDIAKAESEKFAAYSDMYDAEATVTKLQNQFMNYSIRNGMYYITAPQDGMITKLVQTGIGQTIKEGEVLLSLMPSNYSLALESFIEPMDLPLVKIGEKVRIQFDGWPAIVFSGWPNVSYGSYGGIIYAIDNFTNEEGKYRVMIKPDPDDYAWPELLRVGSAAHTMILLNDVPVWYEIWRQINGFPPDYYTVSANETESKSKSGNKK
jgi:adhesin transport system membrane fusion protein